MFKKQFKKYKSRFPPPDLTDVVDMRRSHVGENCKLRPLRPADVTADWESLGLRPVHGWRLFELAGTGGLLLLEDPFTSEGQRLWAQRCLRDFTRKPDCRLNLDAHGDLLDGEDWWTSCCSDPERRRSLLKKLRWSTLGYHHNWDTKVYSDSERDEFPEDLASLSAVVARATGFPDFSAQGAIVNFYRMDSTLSGHTDHSEQDLEAPLLSFSFGQTAIFMVGGRTLEDEATAVFLRSGDVVVMSRQSRRSYHAVPRVLREDRDPPPWGSLDADWKLFGDYLEDSRINVNVRQVLRPGRRSLASPPARK